MALALLILAAGMLFSLVKKKLTIAAACMGAVLGWVIYMGGGFTGLWMLTAFFVLGTAATSWKKEDKKIFKRGEDQHQMRDTGQVLANAGVAGLAGLLMVLAPGMRALLAIMMASALASAAADTLSSELGMVYGRRFYNILSLRPDRKGLDGVVSLEGILIGIGGSAVVAAIFAIGYGQWQVWPLLVIILAGTAGNLADSLLGATLERNGVLSNDAVNFLNTLTAALVAGALAA